MSFLDTESIKEEAIQERNESIAPQDFITASEYLVVRYSRRDPRKYVVVFTNNFNAGITIKDVENAVKGIVRIIHIEMITATECFIEYLT